MKNENKDDDFNVDALALIEEMERIRHLSQDERNALALRIRKRAEGSGKLLVARAIREKVFSRVEWLYFQELGIGFSDMNGILSAYFDSSPVALSSNKGLLTSIGSPIWINRDFIFERFKLKVMCQDDLAKLGSDNYRLMR